MNRLDLIEKRIRVLFEANALILPWADKEASLVHQLCEAMQSYLVEGNLNDQEAPSGFQIFLNPSVITRWNTHPEWEKVLSKALIEISAEFGLVFTNPPALSLVARNSLDEGEVQIKVIEPEVKPGETGAIPVDSGSSEKPSKIGTQTSAYLILPGNTTVPLTRAVTNIGRKSSNQIVVNDLRISRVHAQIRKVQQGYIIFDIGSTGGTFINSERIVQHLLRPGDVISLAGFPMIFTEDTDSINETVKEKTSELRMDRKKGKS